MANEKWNYTPEQANKVKNLKVSNNILKADIKKLEESKVGAADEAAVAAIQAKIDYKVGRIAMKEAQIVEIQEAAGKTAVVYTKKEKAGTEPVVPPTEM